jgi:hypothetical protein
MANIKSNDPGEKRISLVYDPITDSYKAQEAISLDDLTSRGSNISNFAPSTTNGTVLQPNADREELFIQNLGTNNLFVKYGEEASSNSFNFILISGSANLAADGGILSDLNYTGAISVLGANESTPNYIAWERS